MLIMVHATFKPFHNFIKRFYPPFLLIILGNPAICPVNYAKFH